MSRAIGASANFVRVGQGNAEVFRIRTLQMFEATHRGYPISMNPLSKADCLHLSSGHSVVAGDSSLLIDLIQWDDLVVNQILEILDAFGEQVVVPATVAEEVRRLGPDKIQEAVNIAAAPYKAGARFGAAGRGLGKSRHLAVVKAVEGVLDAFRGEVRALATSRFDAVADFVQRHESSPLSVAVYQTIERLAPGRFAADIPPGFTDATKSGGRGFNDVKIWHELMELARQHQEPLFFIMNETKRDWWIRSGTTLSCNPKLVEEMFALSGQRFVLIHGALFVAQHAMAENIAALASPIGLPLHAMSTWLSQGLSSLVHPYAAFNIADPRIAGFEKIDELLSTSHYALGPLFAGGDPLKRSLEALGINSLRYGPYMLQAEELEKSLAALNAKTSLWQSSDFLGALRDTRAPLSFATMESLNAGIWQKAIAPPLDFGTSRMIREMREALGMHGPDHIARLGWPHKDLGVAGVWTRLNSAFDAGSQIERLNRNLAASMNPFQLPRGLDFGLRSASSLQSLFNSLRWNQAQIASMRAMHDAMAKYASRRTAADRNIEALMGLSEASAMDKPAARRDAAGIRHRRSKQRQRIRRRMRKTNMLRPNLAW